MRLLELCLRECAASYGWTLSGNYLMSSKGYLSFILMPALSDEGIEFALAYRYSAFDRVYHAITMANVYPGIIVVESLQTVETWSLMGVSFALRSLTARADKFAVSLADRIINADDNLDFLKYLRTRAINEGRRPPAITTEVILTHLLTGDTQKALDVAGAALNSGDTGNGFYANVIDYIRHRI